AKAFPAEGRRRWRSISQPQSGPGKGGILDQRLGLWELSDGTISESSVMTREFSRFHNSEKANMQERLQKIIARAGIASRRHAEQLILSGQVRVNGRVVTELGTKADAATDRIEAAGRVVKGAERRVYLVLNKPPGIVSAMADPERRKTLKNCLRGFPARVYPVGNLEYTASGLVFLTNDGDRAAERRKPWGERGEGDLVTVKGRLRL